MQKQKSEVRRIQKKNNAILSLHYFVF